MSDDQPHGPPKEDGPGTSTGTTKPTADKLLIDTELTGWPRQWRVADQLGRRRAAAQRLEHGDPWRPAGLSPVHLDACVAACRHLGDLGYTPVIPTTVARQLWATGHRQLVMKVGRSA